MISTQLYQKDFWENSVEGYIFFLKEDYTSASSLSAIETVEEKFYPNLKDILKKHKFKGKKEQSFVLTATKDDKLVQFIFVGIGKQDLQWHVELEAMRRAVGTAVHILKKLSIKTAIFALPDEKQFKVSDTQLLKQLAIVVHMASYEFTKFKTEKKKDDWKCQLLVAINKSFDLPGYSHPLEEGNVIGQAINNARHWADLPANVVTPTMLSEEAIKIAEKHDLKYTVFGREKALELGMGGFCAVDAGSDQDGKFVVLEYHSDDKKASTIALCGKGVIFDTGGLNLKPTSGMEGMKFDMCGAASVIALMDILATFKPTVNVIGVVPMVENMVSGRSTRPDDIITCMNGKTVEIKNTDAEGRLILADALCYAEKYYKPDIIIDIATLTGAVQYALGHFYTGLLTKDEQISKKLLELGKLTGDRVWGLPLDDDFKKAIKSDVADMGNVGSSSYYAGTITAACFLQNFVEKSRWLHLDIAGTAHFVTGVNYVGKGASGSSIRLLTEFIISHQQKDN